MPLNDSNFTLAAALAVTATANPGPSPISFDPTYDHVKVVNAGPSAVYAGSVPGVAQSAVLVQPGGTAYVPSAGTIWVWTSSGPAGVTVTPAQLTSTLGQDPVAIAWSGADTVLPAGCTELNLLTAGNVTLVVNGVSATYQNAQAGTFYLPIVSTGANVTLKAAGTTVTGITICSGGSAAPGAGTAQTSYAGVALTAPGPIRGFWLPTAGIVNLGGLPYYHQAGFSAARVLGQTSVGTTGSAGATVSGLVVVS